MHTLSASNSAPRYILDQKQAHMAPKDLPRVFIWILYIRVNYKPPNCTATVEKINYSHNGIVGSIENGHEQTEN